jgi:predicted RNA-binding protein with EMAP domain
MFTGRLDAMNAKLEKLIDADERIRTLRERHKRESDSGDVDAAEKTDGAITARSIEIAMEMGPESQPFQSSYVPPSPSDNERRERVSQEHFEATVDALTAIANWDGEGVFYYDDAKELARETLRAIDRGPEVGSSHPSVGVDDVEEPT